MTSHCLNQCWTSSLPHVYAALGGDELTLTVLVPHYSFPGPWHHQIHWNKIVVILIKFSSLAALEVVTLTTSSVASDDNFIKMKTFPFLCLCQPWYWLEWRRPCCPLELISTSCMISVLNDMEKNEEVDIFFRPQWVNSQIPAYHLFVFSL